MAPAVSILHLAELDAGETLVKGVAGGAYRTVGTESEGPGDFGGAQHGLDVDMGHGGDHDRSAAGTGLLEGIELVQGDGTLLHAHAEILGNGLQAFVGDGGKDAVGQRSDVFVVLDAEEIGGAELVDELAGAGVEEQKLGIALVVGHLVRAEGGGVVGSALVTAGTVRRSAIEIAGNDGREGTQVLTIVRARRGAHDGEYGLGIRDELHLGMHAEKERAEVQRSLVPVRGKELEIATDTVLAHLDEHLLRWAGHAEIIGSALHAAGVLFGAEDNDLAVLLREGLEALEAGDGVMVDLCEGVKRKRESFGGLGRRPCAVLEMRLYDRAGAIGVEAEGIPINLGHGILMLNR